MVVLSFLGWGRGEGGGGVRHFLFTFFVGPGRDVMAKVGATYRL